MEKSIQTTDYKEIIDLLKQTRISLGFSQEKVARIIEKPQSYISKIESGERRIDIIELKKLAEVYQKPVEFFVK